MDTIAMILFYSIIFTPLIAIPMVRGQKTMKRRLLQLFLSLIIAALLSFILFHISIAIIFRNGMGP